VLKSRHDFQIDAVGESFRAVEDMGSTVNERRIASLNLVRASLSPRLSPSFRVIFVDRESRSGLPDRIASPKFGSRREARSKALERSGRQLPAKLTDCAHRPWIRRRIDIESDIESAFQILDQRPVLCNPGDAPTAERDSAVAACDRSERTRVGERCSILSRYNNVVQPSPFAALEYRAIVVGRSTSFPQRIARAPALQANVDANALVLVSILETLHRMPQPGALLQVNHCSSGATAKILGIGPPKAHQAALSDFSTCCKRIGTSRFS